MKHLMVAAALAVTPVMASADDVYGTWLTQAGETGGKLRVAISACGGAICGKIVGAIAADGKNSPDYEHLGKPIIKSMKASGGGSYKGGTIWAPDTDKTYRSKMSLKGNKLKVSGCVGPICRSQNWTRVN